MVVHTKQSLIHSIAILTALFCMVSGAAFAQVLNAPETKQVRPPGLEHVGIEQRLDQQVPLDLEFRDETGKTVKLGDYFHSGRPVFLNLVYYNCPMLCGEVLQGMTAAMKVIKFTPGKEYEVVTVSIDPREGPDLAAAKKLTFLERLDRPGAEKGWHFLVGQKPQIDALANSLGWEYQYDPKTDQFAHAAGIILVTPKGKIAQYYYGVEYSARDMQLGIVEASHNKIGSLADQVLLYCYHYDPRTGKYGVVITNIVRAAGVATVLILGGFIFVMFRSDSRNKGIGTGRA